MEASALQAPARLTRSRTSLGTPLLRLRSDEQLVTLFREGNDEAFRIIHDRYRQRLFAYTRQMLPGSRQDAEDALQDVFVRAYSGLRANDRDLALRAWLYRVAHNRCIDELRRPVPPAPELIDFVRCPTHDPIAEAERRESLRRLIEDVRRLPDQQRSALLMRELSGMAYAELARALGVSVPAVKSLLVRARVSLAQSIAARDTACTEIREELILAHDRGVRPNSTSRRHLRDCAPCREFRQDVRGLSRQFAAIVPALGPVGVLANLIGAGGSTSGSAAGGVAATGALGGGGVAAATGVFATGAGHVATLLAAAAVTASGAVEIPSAVGSSPVKHHAHHVRPGGPAAGAANAAVALAARGGAAVAPAGYSTPGSGSSTAYGTYSGSGVPAVPHRARATAYNDSIQLPPNENEPTAANPRAAAGTGTGGTKGGSGTATRSGSGTTASTAPGSGSTDSGGSSDAGTSTSGTTTPGGTGTSTTTGGSSSGTTGSGSGVTSTGGTGTSGGSSGTTTLTTP